MGYGYYDYEAHLEATRARAAQGAEAIFKQTLTHPSMRPLGVRRESRDSDAHPDSISIIFALDVSGSMGMIPHELATKTLPKFVGSVQLVLPHPQVMFIALGNAYADQSPLQVGQFESEAALMDHWLQLAHLEGGGGGVGESYDLAMLFAARHTSMDCLEKRGKKGYFFMTGDEPPYASVSPSTIKAHLGDEVPADIQIHDNAKELLRSFNAYFIIPEPSRAATEHHSAKATWTPKMHERCLVLEKSEDMAIVCATAIALEERIVTDRPGMERLLEERFKIFGDERDRVVRVLLPLADALARGPIADPIATGVSQYPGMKG